MSDKQTGGQAFPTVFYSEKGNCIDGFDGMTLRDYFAAKAMQAILSDPNYSNPDDKLAASSYYIADALLVARGA